jgi:apolipoprotein N-acyltransferase
MRLNVLSCLAGACYPLAFAPLSWTVLLFVSLFAFLALLQQSPSKSQSGLTAFFYGLGAFGVGVSWVFISIYEHSPTPLWGALFLTVLFILLLSFLFALPFYGFAHFFPIKHPLRITLGFPLSWLIAEGLRAFCFTGFPWLLCGYALLDTPLAALAPVGSVWLVSAVTLCFCGGIYAFFFTKFRPSYALLCFLTLTLLSAVLYQHRLSRAPEKNIETTTVALIQGAIAQDQRWDPDTIPEIIQRYLSQSDAFLNTLSPHLLAHPLVLVWPESAIPIPLTTITEELQPLWKKIPHLSLITGTILWDPRETDHYFNAVMGTGQAFGTYLKEHLVPFGEYVPGAFFLRKTLLFFDLPNSDYQSGLSKHNIAGVTPFISTKTFYASQSLCYEIAFPHHVRQHLLQSPSPQILMTLSNDTWFGSSFGPHQHLEIARMRALENNRLLFRSTNSGISAIISPTGHVLQKSALEEISVTHYTFSHLPVHNTLWVLYGYIILGLWSFLYVVVLNVFIKLPEKKFSRCLQP